MYVQANTVMASGALHVSKLIKPVRGRWGSISTGPMSVCKAEFRRRGHRSQVKGQFTKQLQVFRVHSAFYKGKIVDLW